MSLGFGMCSLPHSFSRPDIYLKKLDIYFANCGIKSIPILKVRNHPAPSSEMKSLRFEDEINKLLQKHSKIFDKNNNSRPPNKAEKKSR